MTDVWPYQPLTGSTEELEFLSEIHGGYSAEHRLALRPKPRQRFKYGHRMMNGETYSRAKQLVRYTGISDIYVPVWGEWQRPGGTIAAAATTISVDTTWGDWRVGGYLLIWTSETRYAVRAIASMTTTTITLTVAAGQTFDRPTILPIRTAYIMEGASIDRQATLADMEISFCVRDNTDLSALYVSTYPTYQSLDVVTDRPKLIDSVSELVVREAEMVDSELGRVAPVVTKNYANFGQTLSYMDTRPVAWQRRLWLHALRGKQKTFWMPSFNNDLVLQDKIDPADTTILVRSVAQTGVYIGKHIMIELNDNTRYFRSIVNATTSTGGNDILQISSTLGVTVLQQDVRYVTFIAKARIGTDNITMEHRYTDIVVTSMSVIGVPD